MCIYVYIHTHLIVKKGTGEAFIKDDGAYPFVGYAVGVAEFGDELRGFALGGGLDVGEV